MIVRFHIDPMDSDLYEYSVSHEGETLYADVGLGSIEECLVAATEGLDQGIVAAEVAYKSIICRQRWRLRKSVLEHLNR